MNTDVKRNPESAPGDWFIDRRCINCAAARHVAPGLIIERGDYSVFAREPSTPEEVYQAWLAADVYVHQDDRSAAPFANHVLGGATPTEATDLGRGVLAIPVPGHTKGSVVYLVDEKYLFTGDSLTWSYDRGAMRAFRDACWYSWPTQKKSLTGLASYGFNQLFSGHGPWSPWREKDEMKALLFGLTERM